VVLAYLGGLTAFVGGVVGYCARLDRATLEAQSAFVSNFVIFGLILSFVALAAWRKVPLYEVFVEGAKEGFQVAVGIIPYLVAMLVAIGVLRASGALDRILDVVRWGVTALGFDTRWVDALPVGLVRPLSGSGSRGLVIETMKTFGADSFAGRLACVIQGSTETTFYILTVYFGSVGIKKWRHAVPCGLAAEFTGFVAAVFVSYLFFG
jgi:spore maturation protein SpmB